MSYFQKSLLRLIRNKFKATSSGLQSSLDHGKTNFLQISRITENTQASQETGLDDRLVVFKPSASFTISKLYTKFLLSNHVLDTGVHCTRLWCFSCVTKQKIGGTSPSITKLPLMSPRARLLTIPTPGALYIKLTLCSKSSFLTNWIIIIYLFLCG